MEAKSLPAMLRSSCLKWGEKPAMLYNDGGFKPVSYTQLLDTVHSWASVIKTLGLQRGERICIQSESCKEWAFFDWACQTLGIVVVPIYPTLPADQTQYIVQDCGARAVVSSSPEQAAKVEGFKEVRVLFLKGKEGSLEDLAAKLTAKIPMDEWNASIDQAQPEGLATIIYTSGTTGLPKGAMLAHRAITFICEQALQTVKFDEKDTFLSFLPMSHVYERVAGQALPISCGATIAFTKSLMTLANDMVTIKPTIMLCVPRFLEATRDRIIDGVEKQPPLRRKLFGWALAQGVAKQEGKFAPFAGLLDKLVGAKIRERTGGNIRFFVSGGAALPPHVSKFYIAFKLIVLQGYGLTETTAASCLNEPGNNRPDTVGPPIAGVDVSLAADGEILIKGPSRMMGYWNLPKETAEAIDADGWFHTGDIGVFEGKLLKITDRKKDLLILANGKNVAPQPIENMLRESPFISEAVLFGDSNEYIYGLIIPNWERLRAELKLTSANHDLVSDPAAKALIKSEVDKVNKKLADFEKVKKHALLDAVFSVESGELTPSLKVKRKVVREKFASELSDLARN
ncbi:MAG TPA: long-chain fatty acid--CoA ligase [Fimbriimonadaceae bacterium]|jgi:long-chain acyl-CoA synthetase